MGELSIQQSFDQALQHHRTGRLKEAEQLYRQVLARQPNHADAMQFLGVIAQQTGQSDLAVDLIRRAIKINPNFLQAHYNLGNVFLARGEFDEAVAAFGRAIELKPNYAEAFCNIGVALKSQGRLDEAIDAFRRAISLNPNLPLIHSDLANALSEKGQIDEAIASCKVAIAIDPRVAEAHNNLAMALEFSGRFDEAIAEFRQAIALNPDYHEAYDNYLMLLNYHPRFDAQTIFDEHRRWGLRHAEARRARPHQNDRNPGRPLRIGYVSGDFKRHIVARFFISLLENHDRDQFEVFCYSNVARGDEMTARIRSIAGHWREIQRVSDVQAAEQIRADGIDILIDLAGHTAHNRLLIFAHKPAPVQVTYLGYPTTTGLGAIDYRLTDSLADPVDSNDRFNTEKLVRLPRTNWCFAEMEDSMPLEPPPSHKNGFVTFGSFNNLSKVNDAMLDIWANILREVPNSQLLLKTFALGSTVTRQRVRDNLVSRSIGEDRLILRGAEPTHLAHIAMYNQMDIALDTFPYHGTSTTCDALWMGVPVVTLAGQTHASRVGVSLLTNLGLPELVASTPNQYVRIAVGLARNTDRLQTLRRDLRSRLLASPLMDGPHFARDVEAAYRQMWQTYCSAGK